MTIDFYGKEIDKYEKEKYTPYIGYFSKDGKLVDYNTPLGGSHDKLGNIVSWTFLLWIKQSDAFRDLVFHNYVINAELNTKNGKIRNADMPVIEANMKKNLTLLQTDLLDFLIKAESNQEFINLIKKRIDYSKIPEYVKANKKMPIFTGPNGRESLYEIESVFGEYNTKELLLFLKDICVQYLRYDSIEQFKPNGEILEIPKYCRYCSEDYFAFFEKPRVISSVNNNINERFYNYLLMEWKVQQLPKIVLNNNSIEELTNNIQSEKDEEYENEIKLIKKHVPLRERPKYFK